VPLNLPSSLAGPTERLRRPGQRRAGRPRSGRRNHRGREVSEKPLLQLLCVCMSSVSVLSSNCLCRFRILTSGAHLRSVAFCQHGLGEASGTEKGGVVGLPCGGGIVGRTLFVVRRTQGFPRWFALVSNAGKRRSPVENGVAERQNQPKEKKRKKRNKEAGAPDSDKSHSKQKSKRKREE
jgi:hypothetical protein